MFPPIHPDLRFHNYASYLRRRIGGAAVRISVDGGFTCPNRDGTRGTGGCRYCNNDSFTGGILFPGKPVEEQVMRTILSPGRHRNASRLLVYFQRFSNSYAPPEELDRVYRAAFCHPDVAGIVVGTRPDCLGPEALDVLEEIGRNWYVSVEIGLQSKSDAVLSRVNRGHTVDEFVAAVAAARARRIDTGVHLIYGIPGDTRENFVETAGFLSDLDVQGVKLHHFHVVAGSAMAREWKKGTVTVPEYGEYVSACADFLERLSPEVAVLRLVGSASPGTLIAPLWEKGGREMAQDVAAELRRRDTWQGALR
ncbi:MAG TPA: TIGR01212 family radical SAM protein [Candidatus Deferrimicrobiaceae bacterium]|nr:TIGR01212 family radical SAM protein [Candidatus Deferrimicrobiaceae bacterium]